VARDLLILGTGVHGGEMVEIVERANRSGADWNLIGLLATDPKRVGETVNGAAVVGTSAALELYPDACIVPEYEWRDKRSLPRHRLISLIDPDAFVSRTSRIGLGCVIYPGCFIGLNARVGDFAFCLPGCTISHDDVLEDGVTLASGVRLAGSVHIGAGSYLGQGCTVRQNVRIGAMSLVGMGAVVLEDVPAGSVVVGNPARRLRDNAPPAGADAA